MKSKRTAEEAAVDIIRQLWRSGHTALLAGGCVRDGLLGLHPKDFDVATDATPDQVAETFPRTRRVGAQFGVVLVRRWGHDCEVATFRTDGTYSDGRRPDTVSFGQAEDDAKRRDFTINALFRDPIDDSVIDYVGGAADLKAGIIRTVGDPSLRFGEDHLRMLRAVRFAARLGFAVAEETWTAIGQLAARLRIISPERIWMELESMLTAHSRSEAWRLLVESGLERYLTDREDWLFEPSTAPLERLALPASERLRRLPKKAAGAALVMSTLLADSDQKAINQTSRALRWSNKLHDDVSWLVRYLHFALKDEAPELADLKLMRVHHCWEDLGRLMRVHVAACGSGDSRCESVLHRATLIPEASLDPAPLLDGHSLISIGISHGPITGRIIKSVRRAQLNEEINSTDDALRLARELAAGSDGSD